MGIQYLFLLLALIAEIIGTIGGFGSSVFFVPLGNFYFDFYSVLGITALFHLSSNISKIFLFKKGLNKKLILYIGIPSVLFVSVGGLLSKHISTLALEIALGVFLIVLSTLFLIVKRLEVKPTKINSILGGTLSGFSAGMLGTGGAIRGLTMAAFNLEKSVFIATSALIDLMIDATRTVVYFNNGYIHEHDLIYIPFLLVIGLVGTYIGKRILHWIPQENFKRLSLILVLIIGIISILRFVVD
ncbi:MAG: sulfite exporter TauE/SafE family protein [Flavobacteriaceae bacterium]|jgi:uncharacterized membrane protein YfcA|nr:sulfite exporter TauE/SafE family protein [Flavobacteriaceae bacterium]NVJ72947.1 sulfite exporter TauE/SafE family protein [Flavobacteriaceae bacterium]